MRASYKQAFISRNKFPAMHNSIDKIDADNKTIRGESNQVFCRELQKALKKLKFRGLYIKEEF